MYSLTTVPSNSPATAVVPGLVCSRFLEAEMYRVDRVIVYRQSLILTDVEKSCIIVSLDHYMVHSVLEKSLKMLEFGIKTSRPFKVLENR